MKCSNLFFALLFSLCACSPESENKDVSVAYAALNKQSVTMFVGEKLLLKAIITPYDATNQNVNWKSSDLNVVTVNDDGLVTAKTIGKATITATTHDGNKTATCAVNVTDPTLKMVDKNATKETKALLINLMTIQSAGTMFGHHDDLMYGREWYNVPGRSDTKEVCGDYPAIYSLDFAEIMDDRYYSSDNSIRRRCIIEAFERGEVITACIHINNPLTGGDSWDNSNNNVVNEILTDGSATNIKYKIWLDRLADFANNLKDYSGTLIPVLFRPYHEHTQEWSWWGSKCTTQDDFIRFWRFTIEYLRDTKSVRNFLYAISPQIDGNGPRDRLLFRWPGNEYVDFLGMDCYHGTWTQAYQTNLNNMIDVANEKEIPCGVTETGIEGIRTAPDASGIDILDYWTVQMLAPLNQLMQNKGRTVSMVIMWRNENKSTGYHFYGPWMKHPSTPDFLKFYEAPITVFSRDLPDMYQIIKVEN